MVQQMHIAATVNSDFVKPLQVCLLSILQNNPSMNIYFHIIGERLSESEQASAEVLIERFTQCREIEFLNPNRAPYEAARTDSKIPTAAYYRLDLPQMLPKLSRLLYIDCDMVCVDALMELWQTNLQGKVIGAVEDAGYVPRLSEMGIECQDQTYFNSGLLLIDMDAWREQDITVKAQEFIQQHGELLLYHDQDVLNAVLADNWYYLHPRYNAQSRLVRYEQIHADPHREQLAEEARQQPAIIHYSGRSKPWITQGVRLHPWRRAYQNYEALLHRFSQLQRD
ncbi:glycosyltransferase family 8 protein [Furfurilactobacillus curtus]|uniref:Universal stress protein A n=1 Tax=Furfurilactobacillus curtus TaxID=1746200 RepID=A0ABQ5JQ83_9LACO